MPMPAASISHAYCKDPLSSCQAERRTHAQTGNLGKKGDSLAFATPASLGCRLVSQTTGDFQGQSDFPSLGKSFYLISTF